MCSSRKDDCNSGPEPAPVCQTGQPGLDLPLPMPPRLTGKVKDTAEGTWDSPDAVRNAEGEPMIL